MNQDKRQQLEKNLEIIAQRENKTVGEIKQEIGLAISYALKSDNPKVQRFWTDIPCEGDCPTIEEIINYLAGEIAKQQ